MTRMAKYFNFLSRMNKTLKDSILKELCPDGIWQLTDVMKSVLRRQMLQLPQRTVSEDEKRYPSTPSGMRKFLEFFFTRHYFQTQHSLLDYMTSNEFLGLLMSGELRILDIGCGPAVASLAITELLVCILECLEDMGKWPKGKAVKMDYVLNDTSGICLGTGQRMLASYFNASGRYSRGVILGRTLCIQKAFPDNINQIRRVRFKLGMYDITTLSYVISPLDEDKGLEALVCGLKDVEKLCNSNGRILILQDKFQAALVRQVSETLGVSNSKEELTQQIYPSRNMNETYTYLYYRCLYEPASEVVIRQNAVA